MIIKLSNTFLRKDIWFFNKSSWYASVIPIKLTVLDHLDIILTGEYLLWLPTYTLFEPKKHYYGTHTFFIVPFVPNQYILLFVSKTIVPVGLAATWLTGILFL